MPQYVGMYKKHRGYKIVFLMKSFATWYLISCDDTENY